MELKKEFVKNCRKIGVLQEFLCQAIDQIDERNLTIVVLNNKNETLLSCIKCLVMRDLIKDCPEKESVKKLLERSK